MCWPARCWPMRGARPRPARSRGPAAAPQGGRQSRLLGEIFPADPVVIGRMLEPMGLAAGPTVPTREWRELYAALDGEAVAAIHPHYTAATREFEAAGRPVVGSAPVGYEGTAAWLESIGRVCGIGASAIGAARDAVLPAIRGALAGSRVDRPDHALGLRGLGTACRAAPRRARCRPPLRRHRLPAHPGVRDRPRLARSPRRAGQVPRLARTRPRGLPRIQARPCHRHDAGGPARQGGRNAGALLHQPDFGAPADGPGGSGLARPGRECGAGVQAPLRRDARLLRGRRCGRHGGHLAAGAGSPQAESPECRSSSSGGGPDARPRPRPGRRLLGRRLRLHGAQGPPGRHRRAGRLRETCRSPPSCIIPTRCPRTNCRSSSPVWRKRTSARPGPRAR